MRSIALSAALVLVLLGLAAQPAAAQTGGPPPTVAPTPPPPGQPELSISKTGVPSSAPPGTRITYTITVSNPGSADAHNVVVTDDFPPELQILSVTTSKGTATIN